VFELFLPITENHFRQLFCGADYFHFIAFEALLTGSIVHSANRQLFKLLRG